MIAQRLLPSLLPLLILLLTVTACAESHRDIVASYVTGVDQMGERWAALGQDLRSGQRPSPPDKPALEEELALHADGPMGNAEAVAIEQLADPLGAEPTLDLQLSPNALTTFAWTARDRRDDSSTGGDAAFMRSTMDAALAMRYLVVYSNRDYVPARYVEQGSFESGSVTLDVWVIDLREDRLLCQLAVSAESSPEVSTYSRGDDPMGADAQRWLRSDLWSRARQSLATSLREHLGAEVHL